MGGRGGWQQTGRVTVAGVLGVCLRFVVQGLSELPSFHEKCPRIQTRDRSGTHATVRGWYKPAHSHQAATGPSRDSPVTV